MSEKQEELTIVEDSNENGRGELSGSPSKLEDEALKPLEGEGSVGSDDEDYATPTEEDYGSKGEESGSRRLRKHGSGSDTEEEFQEEQEQKDDTPSESNDIVMNTNEKTETEVIVGNNSESLEREGSQSHTESSGGQETEYVDTGMAEKDNEDGTVGKVGEEVKPVGEEVKPAGEVQEQNITLEEVGEGTAAVSEEMEVEDVEGEKREEKIREEDDSQHEEEKEVQNGGRREMSIQEDVVQVKDDDVDDWKVSSRVADLFVTSLR